MGLLDGMLGNASKIDASQVHKEFSQILASGEKVEQAYQLIRDYFIFTNKRLVMVDRQGITGKKIDYHSIPYKSITHFSIETAGHFDLDAELKIWLSGNNEPIQKQFNNRLNIYEVQAVLASYVLGQDELPSKLARDNRPQEQDGHQSVGKGNPKSSVTSFTMSALSTDEDFCFHCGEPVKPNEKKCPSCGGILD